MKKYIPKKIQVIGDVLTILGIFKSGIFLIDQIGRFQTAKWIYEMIPILSPEWLSLILIPIGLLLLYIADRKEEEIPTIYGANKRPIVKVNKTKRIFKHALYPIGIGAVCAIMLFAYYYLYSKPTIITSSNIPIIETPKIPSITPPTTTIAKPPKKLTPIKSKIIPLQILLKDSIIQGDNPPVFNLHLKNDNSSLELEIPYFRKFFQEIPYDDYEKRVKFEDDLWSNFIKYLQSNPKLKKKTIPQVDDMVLPLDGPKLNETEKTSYLHGTNSALYFMGILKYKNEYGSSKTQFCLYFMSRFPNRIYLCENHN